MARKLWTNCRMLPLLTVCGVLLLVIDSLATSAQAAEPVAGGLQPNLPVVPESLPRPLAGAGPANQFDLLREQEPVASFIDTLKGNDAAIEVVVGQGRLLTLKHAADIAGPNGPATISVGDPTILEFQVLPDPRLIRVIGLRAGVTDLSITTPQGDAHSFEVHVVYDLPLLQAQLKQAFPDALLRLGQLREHIIVEGQARKPAQVTHIITTLQAYLNSVQVPREIEGERSALGPTTPPPVEVAPSDWPEDDMPLAEPETGGPRRVRGTFRQPEIINLIRVPGVQQVLLKVRIAELNRTGLREIGADILAVDPDTGNVVGTQIGGGAISAVGLLGLGGLVGDAAGGAGPSTTAFGIFPSGDWEILLRALRRNSLVTILAEPNLIALSGHQASFLAGGEFPIPVPQGGLSNNVTIEFRQFGVRLDFLPFVLDEETVRLTVTPEVSSIDFVLGTTLVEGGDPVPGLNTRRTETTVELTQGQTLAIAGLLQVDLEARTARIPGLGDLPYIGPLFSNTSHHRMEKELLVLVTPYLVQPLEAHQVGPLPGEEIKDPTDGEFYFMNRIEGRTQRQFRPTTDYELYHRRLIDYDRQNMCGPVGLSTLPPTYVATQEHLAQEQDTTSKK